MLRPVQRPKDGSPITGLPIGRPVTYHGEFYYIYKPHIKQPDSSYVDDPINVIKFATSNDRCICHKEEELDQVIEQNKIKIAVIS